MIGDAWWGLANVDHGTGTAFLCARWAGRAQVWLVIRCALLQPLVRAFNGIEPIPSKQLAAPTW